jgi:hypothetical protein
MQLYFEGSFVGFDPVLFEYLLFEPLRTLLSPAFFVHGVVSNLECMQVHSGGHSYCPPFTCYGMPGGSEMPS